MAKDSLPKFRQPVQAAALAFAQEIFTNPRQIPPKTHLVDLIVYEDGHFRAIFDPAYFILPENQAEPSKSQWNSLKKKIKRHHPHVFIFKEHGVIERGGRRYYYLDLGFFAHAEAQPTGEGAPPRRKPSGRRRPSST